MFKGIIGLLAAGIAGTSGAITIKDEILSYKNNKHLNKAIEENNHLKDIIEQLESKLLDKYSSNSEINHCASKILEYLTQCKISVNNNDNPKI